MATAHHDTGLSPREAIVEIVGGLGAGGTDARVLCHRQLGQEDGIKPVWADKGSLSSHLASHSAVEALQV